MKYNSNKNANHILHKNFPLIIKKISLLAENLNLKKVQKKIKNPPVTSRSRCKQYQHVDIFLGFYSVCVIFIKIIQN